MRRPHLIAVVLTLILGAGALVSARQFRPGTSGPADQAAVYLMTGERINGQVDGAPGRGQGAIDRTGFTIESAGGRSRRVPFAQVAYIDFEGSRPNAAELASLPADGHVLVMSNGSTRPGRLVDFDGALVRWQPVRGNVTTIPMREVRRIYLELDRGYSLAQGAGVWTAPEQAGRGGGGRGPGGGFGNNPDDRDIVTVAADQPWTDTNITIKVGEMIRFSAQGRIVTANGAADVGPDGAGPPSGRRFPVPEVPVGALMGKVGTTGRPFAIGSASGLIRMPASGRLMLGINDDHYPDNSGAFRVAIIR